jgi:hypothetical protein
MGFVWIREIRGFISVYSINCVDLQQRYNLLNQVVIICTTIITFKIPHAAHVGYLYVGEFEKKQQLYLYTPLIV